MVKRGLCINMKNHSITVIIPVHNQLSNLKFCIELLRKSLEKKYLWKRKIIVVNIDSNDGAIEWLNSQNDIFSINIDGKISLSKAYNLALEYTDSEMVLFLNSDVYITSNTIEILERYLYSKVNVAAVNPITNNAIRWGADLLSCEKTFPEIYSYNDIVKIADRLLREKPLAIGWKSNYLYGFCMLAKVDAINKINNFDESFYANLMHDFALSVNLIKSGYELLVVPNVFVYNDCQWAYSDYGYDIYNAACQMDSLFKEKFGFYFLYSTSIRKELLNYVNYKKSELAILDVGCAAGSNFTYIKAKNNSAILCGIELCESSANIAKKFADVRNENLEKMDISEWEGKFDYIIMGDIIEHLIDPWSALLKMKKLLKYNGEILASIPNIMNADTIFHILNGNFTYSSAGVLDRTHMRFFTKNEIEKLFNSCGFNAEFIGTNSISVDDPKVNEFANEILKLNTINIDVKDFYTLQYLVKAKIR